MPSIIWFKDLKIEDVPKVGGKNASLGEMYTNLVKEGVSIPNGFAVTAAAYQEFLKANNLEEKIAKILQDLDTENLANLQDRGQAIRQLIRKSTLPAALEHEILTSYKSLSKEFKVENTDVAVRSSATAEDLPGASFAGQQASFLNVVGNQALLETVRNCFASLFTDRAIYYREDKGFDHLKTYLSVGIQKMVRADQACSGVMFTLDPETGFEGVVVLTGAWGLGELIVQGEVIPDEFQIFKDTLKKGYPAIISRELGTKEKTLIYGEGGKATTLTTTAVNKQQQFILSDHEILKLARWGVLIEDHYQKPMDLEWAKDGVSGELFIVQARPETIHGTKKVKEIKHYKMKKTTEMITKGAAVGTKIGEGKAKIIDDPSGIKTFQEGEVLVTRMTDPDWH